MPTKSNLPKWIICLIKKTTFRWCLKIKACFEPVLDEKVEKCILQGDSLSPIYLVPCIDLLSRLFNEMYLKVTVHADETSDTTNHLMFIDYLKLLAINNNVMAGMFNETVQFFNSIGLEINYDCSAINEPLCKENASLLDDVGTYYSGIIEIKAVTL